MEGYYKDTTAFKAIKNVGNAKTDCFAYKEDIYGARCIALKSVECMKHDCKFYKTKEENCATCNAGFINITCEECAKLMNA